MVRRNVQDLVFTFLVGFQRLFELACLLFGCALLALPVNGFAQGKAHSAAKKPNILWIIADDMDPDLGAYGILEVETPTLDRLARRGMRFAPPRLSGR